MAGLDMAPARRVVSSARAFGPGRRGRSHAFLGRVDPDRGRDGGASTNRFGHAGRATAAYQTLLDMGPKLDRDLVRAFKPLSGVTFL